MDENSLLLRAVLREDWDTYNSMAEEFQRQGKVASVATIDFAFYVAVVRYFAKRADLEGEVIRLVAGARAALAHDRDIPARESEALMYAALEMDLPGVKETISGIAAGLVAAIEGHLLFKIVRDENLTDEQIDELLAEAEDVARWQAAKTEPAAQAEASPAEA